MTSILAHTILDLASRNDGYLVEARDPAITALRDAGLIITTCAGDGYLIARAVKTASTRKYVARGSRGSRWVRAVEVGAVQI